MAAGSEHLQFGEHFPKVSSAEGKLFRTCCADRDPTWMYPYNLIKKMNGGSPAWNIEPAELGLTSESLSAAARELSPTSLLWAKFSEDWVNWDGTDEPTRKGLYREWLSGYHGGWGTGQDAGKAQSVQVTDAMRLPKNGADRETYGGVLKPVSQYPFSSDLLLSSLPFTCFGTPPGYKQEFFDPMSDHDPIMAALKV